MARGNEAKERAIKKIAEAFGNDFIGIFDKKVYVWCQEGGERIQLAISMTCPKTPIAADQVENPKPTAAAPTNAGWDFEAMDNPAPVAPKEIEFSEEERKRINSLIKEFNL